MYRGSTPGELHRAPDLSITLYTAPYHTSYHTHSSLPHHRHHHHHAHTLKSLESDHIRLNQGQILFYESLCIFYRGSPTKYSHADTHTQTQKEKKKQLHKISASFQ